MGCWNGTCAISNLHIYANQDVAVFMLAENEMKKSFCYSNAIYDFCPLPFYGEYNDYGAVEDCHGLGLNIIVKAIKEQLYEMDMGENEYHDIPVKKEGFDIEKLFEADHEDRLNIVSKKIMLGYYNHKRIKEYEQLAKKQTLTLGQEADIQRLKCELTEGIPQPRRLTHVIVHKQIFNDILNNFYLHEYVSYDQKTNEATYRDIYFKDVINDLPAYVAALKQRKDTFSYKLEDVISEDIKNTAQDLLRMFSFYSEMPSTIINIPVEVMKMVQDKLSDELIIEYLTEVLKGLWLNKFMSDSRKLWSKQTGLGSQSNDSLPYEILSNSVLDIIKKEDEEDGEDE